MFEVFDLSNLQKSSHAKSLARASCKLRGTHGPILLFSKLSRGGYLPSGLLDLEILILVPSKPLSASRPRCPAVALQESPCRGRGGKRLRSKRPRDMVGQHNNRDRLAGAAHAALAPLRRAASATASVRRIPARAERCAHTHAPPLAPRRPVGTPVTPPRNRPYLVRRRARAHRECSLPSAYGSSSNNPLTRPRFAQLHDQVNLVCLPLLCGLCFWGLADPTNASLCWNISAVFTAYIVADLAWIFLLPECLPRFPGVVAVHHVVTLALLSYVLRHPADAHFTCRDGLVELSTFFLIARRHCAGRLSRACNALYWASTLALRFAMQPYLLWRFVRITEAFPPWERATILTAQSFLCVFNIGLVVIACNAKMTNKRAAGKAA